MKKPLLIALFAGALYAGETLYPAVVKPVSLSPNLKDVAGKLLPTNAVTVLENAGGVIKFEISGYQNPAAPNVVYFTPKARVVAVSFAKTKTPEMQILKKGENGAFNEVKVVAYASAKGWTSDLAALYASAKQKYEESCSVCHELPKADAYPANRWPALIKSMISRTPLNADENWLVSQYLQKHSQDIKDKQ